MTATWYRLFHLFFFSFSYINPSRSPHLLSFSFFLLFFFSRSVWVSLFQIYISKCQRRDQPTQTFLSQHLFLFQRRVHSPMFLGLEAVVQARKAREEKVRGIRSSTQGEGDTS